MPQHGQTGAPPLPQSADERYEIVRVLGRGSFGTVVLAKDWGDGGAEVAIKFLELTGMRQPGNSRLAHREILNHSSLTHPHVRGPPASALCAHALHLSSSPESSSGYVLCAGHQLQEVSVALQASAHQAPCRVRMYSFAVRSRYPHACLCRCFLTGAPGLCNA